MAKKQSKRLLSLIVSLAMVSSFALSPAYAATLEGSVDLGAISGTGGTSEVAVVVSSDNSGSDDSTGSNEVSSTETGTDAQEQTSAAENDTAVEATDASDTADTAEETETETTTTTTTTTATASDGSSSGSSSSESTAVAKLQKKIDSLPSVDEVAEMSDVSDIYSYVSDLWDAYYELTEDEQAKVDTTALEELSDYFNSAIALMTAEEETNAAQIGDTKYATLSAAINAAGTDETTITLLRNVTEEIGISTGKDIVLDLAGFTLSSSESATSRLITMRGGTLTITDSSNDSTGTITTNVNDSVIYIAGGTVIVNDGTISSTHTSGATAAIVNAWQSSTYADYPSTIIVNGGKITANTVPALKNSSTGASITVNNGEIIGYSSSSGNYIVDNTSTANSQNIIINGGYFPTTETSSSTALFYQSAEGNIVVYGGYFTSAISWLNAYLRAAGHSNVELTGSDVVIYNNNTYTYAVVSSNVLYGYISEDGEVTYLGGGANPQQAVNGIKNDTTSFDGSYYIELTENLTATDKDSVTFGITKSTSNSTKAIVLELNGYDISSSSDAAITVQEGATLTVRDSKGTSTVTSAYSNGTVRNRGGVLTIESGTYTNTADGGCIIQNNGSDTATDSTYITTVTGGYFNGNAPISVSKGSVTVTGGYFTTDPTTYIPTTGYVVADGTDETYPYYVTALTASKGMNLDSGLITLNVYVEAGDVADTNQISPKFGTKDAGTNATVTVDDEGKYTVAQNVNASEMVDSLVVTVMLDNDYTYTYTTSVKAYADELLAEGSTATTDQKVILQAMLDYGSAVQELVASIDGSTVETYANGGMYTSSYSSVEPDTIKSAGGTKKTYTKAGSNTTEETRVGSWTGPQLASMNMNVSYAFNLTLNYSAELSGYGISVTIGDTTYTTDNSDTISVDGSSLTITGISAADMMKTLEVKITDSSDSDKYYRTVTAGIYYARLMLNANTTEAQNKVAQTMYLYAKAFTSNS